MEGFLSCKSNIEFKIFAECIVGYTLKVLCIYNIYKHLIHTIPKPHKRGEISPLQ